MGASDSKADFETYTKDGDDEFVQYESGGKHFITDPSEARPINVSKKGVASLAPTTIIKTLCAAVERFPDAMALRKEYRNPQGEYEWREWTWTEYYAECLNVAKALIAIGFKPHDCINVIGFNCPEWFFADVGAVLAGGIAAGIYTTNNPGACQYITEHSKASVVFVENWKQLEKFLEIRENLPNLKYLVVWDDLDNENVHAICSEGLGDKAEHARVVTYTDFILLGQGSDGKDVEARWFDVDPGHTCTLIYTSGTTGNPKAVMASHDNLIWEMRSVMESMNCAQTQIGGQPERIISYLPLSHIAAQMLDICGPMCITAFTDNPGSTTFARPDALKGTIGDTLRDTSPTIFFGVPRVWEKIQEKMIAASRAGGGCKRSIAKWAKGKGLTYVKGMEVTGDGSVPFGKGLASALVFKKVAGRLGLTECNICVTGAAPIKLETLEFFGSLGIIIHSLFGMSETSGAACTNRPYHFIMGGNGPPMKGTEVKLIYEEGRDKKGQGEICMRGRHIMLGYMHNEEKSRQTIDSEGWLHSGDVGEFRNDCLYITGRIKELIIGAGGENIAPVPIENYIKTIRPGISNFVMIGDKRKYNVALVTLKTEGTPQGGFSASDKLLNEAAEVDGDCKTVGDALESKAWTNYIQSGIDEYNANGKICVSRAQKIQKFVILDVDFSVPQGTIGPTLKLKRPVVNSLFNEAIDKLYAATSK